MTPVYIMLGAAGSGRREILLDLVEANISDTHGTNVIYLSDAEDSLPIDEMIHSLDRGMVLSYQWESDTVFDAEDPPADTEAIFVITDGRRNPINQIEALKSWIEAGDLELIRIFTVVNCALVEEHSALFKWYEACIHFSDVVLLNRRDSVSNKWMKAFLDHYRKHCYPCQFEYVKKGHLTNPANLLYPEARRLSLIFDDVGDSSASVMPYEDIIIEGDYADEEDDDLESVENEDPYLARLENGRRRHPIPDIIDYIGSSETSE